MTVVPPWRALTQSYRRIYLSASFPHCYTASRLQDKMFAAAGNSL
jgi:hypothetical protein